MRPRDGELRVMVTVSQTWKDADRINRELAAVWHEFGRPAAPVLVSGHAPEGDAIAEECWRARGFRVEEYPARWHEHGDDCPDWHAGRAICLKAGHRRNAVMVASRPHVVLAFIKVCVKPKPRCTRRPPHGTHGATRTAELALEAGLDVRLFEDGFLGATVAAGRS